MINIINDRLDLLEDELEDDITVQQAWTEVTEIAREQERYVEMRAAAEKELEACRKRSAMLEDVRNSIVFIILISYYNHIQSYIE